MNGAMIRCLAVMALVVMAPAATAADRVPAAYGQVAQFHGIPSGLFYAVALAESGKQIERLRARRPWPWTLNVDGDGRYFPSRQAAAAALRQALARGHTSVDVGLMQVNWRYHGTAFGGVEDALDPYRNLHVAASILRTCYRTWQDWWAAVGCYHAPNDRQRAAHYRERVRSIWNRLAVTG